MGSPGEGTSRSPKDLFQLSRAYAKCGGDIWKSSWNIGFEYVGHALAETAKIVLGARTPEQISETLFLGFRNYCMEMAGLLPAAIDELSRELDQNPAVAEPFESLGCGDAPPTRPTTYVIRNVPVMMPVRIADASQGWALYFVSTARAQSHLEKQGQPFTVLDVGCGRTPLTVLGMEYRGTDLGAYQEIGIALFVTPRDDPRERPGLLFLSLTVSDEFNVERATVLWGYRKTLSKTFDACRHEATARFAIDRSDPTALSVTFPIFGSGRSTNISCYTYGTIRDATGREVPRKTLISRNATGEGMQIGGAVDLRLGNGKQERCVCRLGPGPTPPCVCLILRDLGLSKRPAANGWAEHMDALVADSTPIAHGTRSADKRSLHGVVTERISGGVVTEKMIVAAAKAGKRLVLEKGVVLTPLAGDTARELGLEIEREG